jgi:hypothetical protein
MQRVAVTLAAVVTFGLGTLAFASAQSVSGPTYSRAACIKMCKARGPNRTTKDCTPWCAPGCRKSAKGEPYCVKG